MRGSTSTKPGKRTEQPAPRPGYRRSTGVANPIDVEVGGRIRTRRLLLGMNQQALADALDLTFQQVQKYEHGATRVSASRLAAMATILAVPISYFFADLQSDGAEPRSRTRHGARSCNGRRRSSSSGSFTPYLTRRSGANSLRWQSRWRRAAPGAVRRDR
jgi:transcriptional regulator with XRE-family HTH domain